MRRGIVVTIIVVVASATARGEQTLEVGGEHGTYSGDLGHTDSQFALVHLVPGRALDPARRRQPRDALRRRRASATASRPRATSARSASAPGCPAARAT